MVSVGDPIGFTLTVGNTGEGLAHDVTLMDTLPSDPGLSWSEDRRIRIARSWPASEL